MCVRLRFIYLCYKVQGLCLILVIWNNSPGLGSNLSLRSVWVQTLVWVKHRWALQMCNLQVKDPGFFFSCSSVCLSGFGVMIRARVLNCVDGVNIALLQKAIEGQRSFFRERERKDGGVAQPADKIWSGSSLPRLPRVLFDCQDCFWRN